MADKAYNNTNLLVNSTDFSVSGVIELKRDTSDIYGRNGSMVLALKKNGVSGFTYMFTLCRGAGGTLLLFIKTDLGYSKTVNVSGFNINVVNRYALSYKIGIGLTISLNGVNTVFADATLPSLYLDFIDTNAYDGTPSECEISNMVVYDTALSDAELLALTTIWNT